MEEKIGLIIGTLGLIGILVMLGIGAFRIGVALGWMYIFIIMFAIGGSMAGWDDKPWWY